MNIIPKIVQRLPKVWYRMLISQMKSVDKDEIVCKEGNLGMRRQSKIGIWIN